MSDDASKQLRRILALIPTCADEKAHPIDQLARRAGTDVRTLMRDVRALTERLDDPGGFVEAVRIFVDGDDLHMVGSHFLRPMRLTMAELAAVSLGLSLLRAERPPEEWPALDRARKRLEAALAKVPQDLTDGPRATDGLYHATLAETADPAVLALLRKAWRSRTKVDLEYLKADQTTPSRRVVCPFAIVFSSGHWYLVAQCPGTEGIRVFRVDRVVKATLLDEAYQVPEDFAVDQVFADGRAFASPVAEKVTIRFSPRIARWIAERDGREVDADGGYVQELPLADLDWLGRYVLQYGAEAEVVGPPAARAAVAARLASIAAMVPGEAG